MSVLLRFDVISTSRETIRLDDFDFDCIPRIVKDIMMNVMWDLEKRGHAAAGQMDSEDAMFLKRIRQRGYRLDDLKWICIKKTPPVKRGVSSTKHQKLATPVCNQLTEKKKRNAPSDEC